MDDLENETLKTEAPKTRKRTQRRENPRAESERKRSRGATGEDRVPMGIPLQKLSVRDYGGQLEGHKARFVNDEAGRIQDFIRGGWMPVYEDGSIEVGEGEYDPDRDLWVTKVVGSFDSGKPKVAYLMKIKEKWYNADQANKAAKIKEVDDSIKNRGIDQPSSDQHYVKTADYKI